MKRREFIALTAGAAAWPLAARAQPARTIEIGFVTWGSSAIRMRVEDLRQGLRDFGYVEGKTITIEYRYAEQSSGRLAMLAAELVALNLDVILTTTPAATRAGSGPGTAPCTGPAAR